MGVLGREGAMVPDTVLAAWPAISQALALNQILRELDLSDCAMGSEGFTHLRYASIATISVGLFCHIIGLFCHMVRSLLTRICMPQVCQ